MSKCDLCGQDAGILRKRHKECESRHAEGVANIIALACDAALAKITVDALPGRAKQMADNASISQANLTGLYANGFERAVQSVLQDGVMTEQEEEQLEAFMKALGLGQKELDALGAYTTMVKAGILREVLEGKLPERINVFGDMPFNFQKGEKLIWLFQDVTYCEPRTTTRYLGSYQGVSIRVAKGLYYRTGAFQGNPVPTTQTVPVDTGVLGITNKHLYFSGSKKSFRSAYNKIMAITPYTDGVGIQKDVSSAKPQIFITADGWFTYNLVSNLARLAGD
jgi:hypothetical protein